MNQLPQFLGTSLSRVSTVFQLNGDCHGVLLFWVKIVIISFLSTFTHHKMLFHNLYGNISNGFKQSEQAAINSRSWRFFFQGTALELEKKKVNILFNFQSISIIAILVMRSFAS